MIRRVLLFVAVVGLGRAHEPITTKLTWTREISRIFYKRCVSCHREGGSAMSLATYEEARPWAKAIKEEVIERRMPPWGAVKGFGEFRNDPSLSEVEIELIANWVEGGAPNGEPIYLLPPPVLFFHGDPPPASKPLAIQEGTTLSRDVVAVGIEPSGLVKVTAERPDGTIEPLLWVHSFRPELVKAYYFREPLSLPKGTRVRVTGSARLLLR